MKPKPVSAVCDECDSPMTVDRAGHMVIVYRCVCPEPTRRFRIRGADSSVTLFVQRDADADRLVPVPR